MKYASSYHFYRQNYSRLTEQLRQCYIYDRYPIKKLLDQLFRLLKKLPRNEQGAGHKKNKVLENQFLAQFERCEKKLKQSIKRVQQRQRSLPEVKFPEQLPVSSKSDLIRELIEWHQVIVVAGETGSGKTTQLPKIALMAGRGIFGQIAHTQPRRLAARSVAARIAEELQTPLGDKVGFKVRFSDRSHLDTLVKLMTDGILLAETQTDRFLNQYDTIIIDEAHERSLNIDFLLGYIKRILPRRPDLKVIITSATIDTERFSEFFNNAPVIEVSGRTFPVEIRYRPLEDEQDMVEGIVRSVEELSQQRDGDILVFLSGEKEIRETAEALRKHPVFHHTQRVEILPLYARLSPAEQNRIFAPHSGQRIILATNVAETSLTVPGIRYVIDTGYARISRYSVRHKIQRLPIEKISQASARQRSGRCGRISDGVAIRLYSEEDHQQRPGFTEPELLRTNLAQVILQMLSLKLGDIKEFPFLEKPSAKQINDGFLLLEQLGAITAQRKLTAIGRSLSRLSVDPRIGRVIIAAEKNGVLSEVLIIASALSCQDPRERPLDKQQAADQQHALYAYRQSDFISYLNLWFLYESQRQHLSQNKLRKYCQSHFLSFMRMREWRELYQQLYTQTRELKFRFNPLPDSKDNELFSDDATRLDYAAIHQSLLSGFLANIGFKEDKNSYLGARNMRFNIFPGSQLYKRKPKWLMAAEIVETSGIYARIAAAIEPGWLEHQAQHLIKHHYFDPFWEAKTGQVSAWSRVSLYGLTINPKKKVNYGPIDPQVAQEIFIRDALVTGQYKDNNRKTPSFIAHNLALISDLEHLEHKSRRQDLLVDDLAIFEFYQQRIEHDLDQQSDHKSTYIYSRSAFEQWRKRVEKQQPDYLFLEQSDLLKKDSEHISDELYPPYIQSADLQLPLEYHFLPGHALDGVTVVLPLAVINQLDEQVFDWLVPGLIREKITLLMRALPKVIRKQFVPVPDTVTAFLESVTYGEGRLLEQLLTFLKSRLSYTLANQLEYELGEQQSSDFDNKLPEHLKMNFKLLDKDGHELQHSRSLYSLKQSWAEQALEQIETEIEDSIERQNIQYWDFDTLAEQIEHERHGMLMTLYPALQDCGDSVAIKLFDQQQTAVANHAQGIYRLLQLALTQSLKQMQKKLPGIDKACLLFSAYGSCQDFKQDISNAVLVNAIGQVMLQGSMDTLQSLGQIRTLVQFEQLLKQVQAQLDELAEELMQSVINALQAARDVSSQLKGNIPFNLLNTMADIKSQLSHLIYKGFVSQTPLSWLKRLPRYFKGMSIRIEKAANDYRRDALNQSQTTPLWERYETLNKQHKKVKNMPEPNYFPESELIEYRWLIEELRISLFAQELKTVQPVSVKRLEKKWLEIIK